MTLRRKLVLAMLIPAVLLGLVGAIGVYSLLHLDQAAGPILADNYRSIQETRRMESALRSLDSQEDGTIDGARTEAIRTRKLRGSTRHLDAVKRISPRAVSLSWSRGYDRDGIDCVHLSFIASRFPRV